VKTVSNYVQVVVGLVIGVGLTWLAMRNVNWDRVESTLRTAEYGWIGLAVVLIAAHYAVKAWRWRILLATRAPVPFSIAFRTMAVGFMMNNLLPARIGEMSSRPYLLSTNCPTVGFSFGLATVLGAKVLDLLIVGGLLLVSATWFTLPDEWIRTAMWVVGGVAFVGVAGGMAAFRWSNGAFERRLEALLARVLSRVTAGKMSSQIDRFSQGMAALGNRQALVSSLLISVLAFAVMGAGIVCTAKALHLSMGVRECVMVLALMGVGFALPAPPTYAGNIHYFVTRAVVLSGLGGEDAGFSMGVLVHAVEVVVICGLGLASLPGLKLKRDTPPDS